MLTWLIENWLAVLVMFFGVAAVIIALVVYAACWIAGRDDALLEKIKRAGSERGNGRG